MSRTAYRFVDYVTRQDPTGELSWSAVCVSGDEADCGAFSGETDEETAVKWMAEHTRDTEHTRYRRTFVDYATVEPKA
ncbi:hypothetical protein ACIP6X_06125 [Streptomyces coeruleorubidus]|uniref:DUF7848 domain-containing protein n=1 Tax=Streptomyces coeruleorubidus TaxID=116188 RepID=UPI003802E913